MIRDPRGRGNGRGKLIVEAAQALQYLEAMGHEQNAVLLYHPVARGNPFLATIYGGMWERGIASLPLNRLRDLSAIEPLLAAGRRVILHLHWIKGWPDSAKTEAEMRAASETYLNRIDAFLEAGGRLAWTVHNVLPHDTGFPELAAALQQAVVDRAEIVHIMNAGTVAEVGEWFKIPPEKVVQIPHPNYRSAYQDIVTRDQARYDLGLSPDEIVYAAVGSIQPYKGLELLLDAFDAVAKRSPRPRRIVLAGAPAEVEEVDVLLDRCLLHPQVVLSAKRVPDVEMQLYLRAADVVVLPYRRSLNSGVLLLALSFGLPVVVATAGIDNELTSPDVARTFEPGNLDSLADALLSADELLAPGTREAALRLADTFDPMVIRRRFADEMVERFLG